MKTKRRRKPPQTAKARFEKFKSDPWVYITYFVLRAVVIAILVLSIIDHAWENAFICVLVLLIYMLPSFLEKRIGIEFPSLLEIIILIHVFAAEILGELGSYFVRYQHWDTLLHITWGFLCAALGFSLVRLLNRNSRIGFELSPFYLALVAFCFSMTIGVLWEFFECSMDQFFDKDMQKDVIVKEINSVSLDPEDAGNVIHVGDITETVVTTSSGDTTTIEGYLDVGILDTMKDLLVNLIGAVVFSTIGYLSLKRSKSSKVANSLMIQPNERGPRCDRAPAGTADRASDVAVEDKVRHRR